MSHMRPPRPTMRQPFPPADDYVDDDPADEAPFELHSEYVPTLTDLSQQIAAQSTHIVTLHRESAIMHHTVRGIDGKVDGLATDLRELRRLVTGDHAPRITAVEQSERHSRITIPPALRRGAAKGAIGAGLISIYPVAEALLPLLRKLIEGQ